MYAAAGEGQTKKSKKQQQQKNSPARMAFFRV